MPALLRIRPSVVMVLLATATLLAQAPIPRPGQFPAQSPEDEMAERLVADALRSQPPKDYEFNRAVLRDVLRFLATDAGISFVSVPEAGEIEERLVTFSLRESPFRALEIIARANGVALFYEQGIWYLRPFNDKELVARTYKIKYNTQETVTSDSAAASAPTATTGAVGGTGVGASPDLGLSLEGVTNVFTVDPQQLIDDVRSLLGIPTTSFEAANAGEVSVDSLTEMGLSPQTIVPGSAPTIAPNVAGEPGGPQVIWNSDSNTLYVVATRQQQQWVEGYLQSMDRPQPLIAIEVKFLETNKDPRESIGVDWSGTLQDGLTFSASQIRATPSGDVVLETTSDAQSRTGTPPADDTAGLYDYTERTTLNELTVAAPYSAVLSVSDVAFALQAFLNDRDSSQVSYPRVLTRNNREVVIRSVINQPVLASSSSVTQGIGGTTADSVSYLPIGTIINVLPKEMADGSVALNVAISISNIIGEVPIGRDNNLYPVASTRVFNAALSVKSGYTLAIGGLEEARDDQFRRGIPFLKDIPLLGEAFKSNDRSQQKKNLILFITPTLLPAGGVRGISETPEAVLPVPDVEPSPPAFTPDGMLVGGRNAIPAAIRWIRWKTRLLQQIVTESRTDQKTIDEIEALLSLCARLQAQTDLMIEAIPDDVPTLAANNAELQGCTATLTELLPKARADFMRF